MYNSTPPPKPSRELDALVAEKVMGFKILSNWETGVPKHVIDANQCEVDVAQFPKPYSTDIAAAWEVVLAMEARGFCFTLISTPAGKMATFYTPKQREEWDSIPTMKGSVPLQVQADTAPHAICVAALKVVGVDLSKL